MRVYILYYSGKVSYMEFLSGVFDWQRLRSATRSTIDALRASLDASDEHGDSIVRRDDFVRALEAFKVSERASERIVGKSSGNPAALQTWEIAFLCQRFAHDESDENINIAAFIDALVQSEGSNSRLGTRLDTTMLGATVSRSGDSSSLTELEGMFQKLQAFMRPPVDVDLTGSEAPVDSTAALYLRFKQFDEKGKDYIDATDVKVRL